MSLTVRAHAKINLWLDITGKRDDGYHTLNTVMRKIDLYDDVNVEIDDTGAIIVACDDMSVPSDERNIAYRAAAAFSEAAGIRAGAHIRIKKRIPTEAGLGGSSADGAAVLVAMNALYEEQFDGKELLALGERLGADVPFCIAGGTAKCTGIGEKMVPLGCADFALVVVKPDFSCSTAAAYAAFDRDPIPEKDGFTDYCCDITGSAAEVAGGLYNVFERLYDDPRIDDIKRELMSAGALGASLTGSGSAVFGIFRTLPDAQAALRKIDRKTKFAVKTL